MKSSEASYAPSWVDRLMNGVDTLPVPAWVAYLGVFAVVALAGNLAAWIDGSVEFGQAHAYETSLGFYVAMPLVGMHYLDLAASRAWRTFRPALQVDDEAAAAIEHRLTTMPARATLGVTLLSVAPSVLLFVSFYGTETSIERTPVTLLANGVNDALALCLTFILGYHSLRQLRLIDQLHRRVETVDLLHLTPLHAFARVSSATGIVLIALIYVSVLTNPASLANVGLIVGLGLTVALAVACFLVPLYGMHTRIAAAKARRLDEIDRRLSLVMSELDRTADEADPAAAETLGKRLSSTITQRQVVQAVSTWPWQADTLRWFVTAIVAPLALWLTYRILEQQLA